MEIIFHCFGTGVIVDIIYVLMLQESLLNPIRCRLSELHELILRDEAEKNYEEYESLVGDFLRGCCEFCNHHKADPQNSLSLYLLESLDTIKRVCEWLININGHISDWKLIGYTVHLITGDSTILSLFSRSNFDDDDAYNQAIAVALKKCCNPYTLARKIALAICQDELQFLSDTKPDLSFVVPLIIPVITFFQDDGEVLSHLLQWVIRFEYTNFINIYESEMRLGTLLTQLLRIYSQSDNVLSDLISLLLKQRATCILSLKMSKEKCWSKWIEQFVVLLQEFPQNVLVDDIVTHFNTLCSNGAIKVEIMKVPRFCESIVDSVKNISMESPAFIKMLKLIWLLSVNSHEHQLQFGNVSGCGEMIFSVLNSLQLNNISNVMPNREFGFERMENLSLVLWTLSSCDENKKKFGSVKDCFPLLLDIAHRNDTQTKLIGYIYGALCCLVNGDDVVDNIDRLIGCPDFLDRIIAGLKKNTNNLIVAKHACKLLAVLSVKSAETKSQLIDNAPAMLQLVSQVVETFESNVDVLKSTTEIAASLYAASNHEECVKIFSRSFIQLNSNKEIKNKQAFLAILDIIKTTVCEPRTVRYAVRTASNWDIIFYGILKHYEDLITKGVEVPPELLQRVCQVFACLMYSYTNVSGVLTDDISFKESPLKDTLPLFQTMKENQHDILKTFYFIWEQLNTLKYPCGDIAKIIHDTAAGHIHLEHLVNTEGWSRSIIVAMRQEQNLHDRFSVYYIWKIVNMIWFEEFHERETLLLNSYFWKFYQNTLEYHLEFVELLKDVLMIARYELYFKDGDTRLNSFAPNFAYVCVKVLQRYCYENTGEDICFNFSCAIHHAIKNDKVCEKFASSNDSALIVLQLFKQYHDYFDFVMELMDIVEIIAKNPEYLAKWMQCDGLCEWIVNILMKGFTSKEYHTNDMNILMTMYEANEQCRNVINAYPNFHGCVLKALESSTNSNRTFDIISGMQSLITQANDDHLKVFSSFPNIWKVFASKLNKQHTEKHALYPMIDILLTFFSKQENLQSCGSTVVFVEALVHMFEVHELEVVPLIVRFNDHYLNQQRLAAAKKYIDVLNKLLNIYGRSEHFALYLQTLRVLVDERSAPTVEIQNGMKKNLHELFTKTSKASKWLQWIASSRQTMYSFIEVCRIMQISPWFKKLTVLNRETEMHIVDILKCVLKGFQQLTEDHQSLIIGVSDVLKVAIPNLSPTASLDVCQCVSDFVFSGFIEHHSENLLIIGVVIDVWKSVLPIMEKGNVQPVNPLNVPIETINDPDRDTTTAKGKKSKKKKAAIDHGKSMDFDTNFDFDFKTDAINALLLKTIARHQDKVEWLVRCHSWIVSCSSPVITTSTQYFELLSLLLLYFTGDTEIPSAVQLTHEVVEAFTRLRETITDDSPIYQTWRSMMFDGTLVALRRLLVRYHDNCALTGAICKYVSSCVIPLLLSEEMVHDWCDALSKALLSQLKVVLENGTTLSESTSTVYYSIQGLCDLICQVAFSFTRLKDLPLQNDCVQTVGVLVDRVITDPTGNEMLHSLVKFIEFCSVHEQQGCIQFTKDLLRWYNVYPKGKTGLAFIEHILQTIARMMHNVHKEVLVEVFCEKSNDIQDMLADILTRDYYVDNEGIMQRLVELMSPLQSCAKGRDWIQNAKILCESNLNEVRSISHILFHQLLVCENMTILTQSPLIRIVHAYSAPLKSIIDCSQFTKAFKIVIGVIGQYMLQFSKRSHLDEFYRDDINALVDMLVQIVNDLPPFMSFDDITRNVDAYLTLLDSSYVRSSAKLSHQVLLIISRTIDISNIPSFPPSLISSLIKGVFPLMTDHISDVNIVQNCSDLLSLLLSGLDQIVIVKDSVNQNVPDTLINCCDQGISILTNLFSSRSFSVDGIKCLNSVLSVIRTAATEVITHGDLNQQQRSNMIQSYWQWLVLLIGCSDDPLVGELFPRAIDILSIFQNVFSSMEVDAPDFTKVMTILMKLLQNHDNNIKLLCSVVDGLIILLQTQKTLCLQFIASEHFQTNSLLTLLKTHYSDERLVHTISTCLSLVLDQNHMESKSTSMDLNVMNVLSMFVTLFNFYTRQLPGCRDVVRKASINCTVCSIGKVILIVIRCGISRGIDITEGNLLSSFQSHLQQFSKQTPIPVNETEQTVKELFSILEQYSTKSELSAAQASNNDESTATTGSLTNSSIAIIPMSDLTVGSMLEINVYKGCWRRCTDVAIKINRGKKSLANTAIEKELSRLCALRHPRIVSVLGVCIDFQLPSVGSSSSSPDSFHGLVLEYMDKGTLRTVLNTEHTILSWASKLTIAVDICDGMRFLHESNVTHGALNGDNVLVDSHGRAKLTGFGSDFTGNISETSNQARIGTQKKPNTSSHDVIAVEQKEDVFSYGAILWEIVTGKKLPWSDNKQSGRKTSKLVLTKEEIKDCLPVLASIMKDCLEAKAADRPAFADMFPTLHQLHVQETKSWKDKLQVIPDGFTCPITQDIMKDPVMLLDGHSYERASIEDWLSKNERSPMTNEILSDKTTVLDNYALKSAIESFMKHNPHAK